MMIKGIGTDMVKLERVEHSIEKFGEQFAKKILHLDEFAIYQRHNQPAAYLAKRFAAKEAVVKALGTGFRHGITLSDIQVVNNELGQPSIILHGKTKAYALAQDVKQLHLSLSDEREYAIAFVVIE